MTGARLELGNPESYATAREYIESHLAPAVTELHRITNELLSPGTTSAEEWSVDMVPGDGALAFFQRLDRPLEPTAKHVVFDGADYFKIAPELLRTKQLKVQLTAVLYAQHVDDDPGTVEFRLVRDDGTPIKGSHVATYDAEPHPYTRILSFGEEPGCISPDKRTYFIEGCSPYRSSLPVCRRFSLSFIYI